MSLHAVPDQATIAVVTAWRDHLELADDYFKAIDAAQPDQLVIVDDGSDEPLPFAATRIDPTGFCAANNTGIALVETDYVLMLNNDVKMLRPTWLQSIRELVEPGVLVGPLRYDPHGTVDGTVYPYVDGWCAAMCVEDLLRIGGLDERYDDAGPAYFSDNHLSLVARANGITLRDIRPGLEHKGGQTAGSGPQFHHALKVNGAMFADDVRALVGLANAV